MNEELAREILKDDIEADLVWIPKDLVLDGVFSIAHLEAIVWWTQNKGKAKAKHENSP